MNTGKFICECHNKEFKHKRSLNEHLRYERNRDIIKEGQKTYYQANREKAAIYFQENKEKITLKAKKYFLTPKGIFQSTKSGARKRKIEFRFNANEFVGWYEKQPQICYYCNRTLEQVLKNSRGITRLTIDRIDNNLGYFIKNMVLCCFLCNEIKHDYFTEAEMLQIGKIIYNKEIGVYNEDIKKEN